MSEERAVILIPCQQEMLTIRAASSVNVSNPFVTKESETGRLTCRKVGSHQAAGECDEYDETG